MANHALLNNISHQNLKVITRPGAEFGDNLMCAQTYPFEFREIQAHYPIFFSKDKATGTFHPFAMFGFEQNENLFLSVNIWDAPYIPMIVRRGPFLIGYQGDESQGKQEMVISVDMDNPRLSESEGEAIFLAEGGNSEYIEDIAAMLHAIHNGQGINAEFTALLNEFDLLEPFSLDITLNSGHQHTLTGFHTINEERLQSLGAEDLAKLHKKDALQAIYMALASLSNIRDLIDRKNQS